MSIKRCQVRIMDNDKTVLVGHKAASRLFELDVRVPLACMFSRVERTEDE